ncbi:MAG TPA: NAD(P)/FAD-dependent oxidoreductase [Herpetosiphonaceae bacterium]
MIPQADRRVAVIGAGISGIAAANMLKKQGYEVVVFEKAASLGGVWAVAYPGVRLQNLAVHYHLSDLPWPFTPDAHPTREQILRYLCTAVQQLQLDVRLSHEVLALEEQPDGWLVRYRNPSGEHEAAFGYIVIAVGQYTEGKYVPQFPGQADFHGSIVTEREITDPEVFDGKRVVVVGFGKSALDMVTFAALRGAQVSHVFRTPRWLMPEWILGVHMTYALFTRFGSVMMPSWGHPTAAERFLHRRLEPVVAGFWRMIAGILRFQVRRHASGRDRAAQERLKIVQPAHPLVPDLRSAAAIAPAEYYRLVAEGKIQPYQSEVCGFSHAAIRLQSRQELPCDLVVLSVGSQKPAFAFLPQQYRDLLEAEVDGVQLYRHLIHPRIPRLGFAGFNHGFMHVPAVEVGALWLCAYWRGKLELPSLEEMERSIAHMTDWKRTHIHFEPSRLCATSTRFQQYLDILLKDLGISPYRKLPNVFAEVFGRYTAADYHDILQEYSRRQAQRTAPLQPIPVHM